MSQALPTGGFQWIDAEDIKGSPEMKLKDKILELDDNDQFGYMLEVDLEYPQDLHDKHDTYPLAPERLIIKEDMLSLYQKEQARELGIKVGGTKLCLTLTNKMNYITHYRNLKQYIKMGMKIKKVHKVLRFKQSAWLKCYIDLNTELRKLGVSEFEQNFAKLMNNSFFGKVRMSLYIYIYIFHIHYFLDM